MERQYRLEGGGSLTVRADSLRAAVEAEHPADGRGLYKAYLRGPAGRALLGTLAPEGGRLRIKGHYLNAKDVKLWTSERSTACFCPACCLSA